MIRLYALGAALLGCLALGGVVYWQTQRLDAAKAQNAALVLALQASQARVTNMIEDKESDNAIDQIPDDGLRVVPNPCWMLTSPDCGGVY